MNHKALAAAREQVCCITHCLLNCPATTAQDVNEMLFAYMNQNGLLSNGGDDSELIESFVNECDNDHISRSVHRIGHKFDDVFMQPEYIEFEEIIPLENKE